MLSHRSRSVKHARAASAADGRRSRYKITARRYARRGVSTPWLVAALLTGCAADASIDGLTTDGLGGDAATLAQALVEGEQVVGAVLFTVPVPPRLGAPMFEWAATDAPLLREIPIDAVVTVAASAPRNDFYQVVHAGTWGWIPASGLEWRHDAQVAASDQREQALALARTGLGFSYWWSNAHWSRTGVTLFPDNNAGVCTGVCGGNCTHSPTGPVEYGADCSGFISTVWGFPDNDPETNELNNGFATRAYAVNQPGRWSTIAFADAIPGDAIVYYNQSTRRGHIFLVAVARDARGDFVSYECMGCAQGCRSHVRRIRDAAPGPWHAIRRAGAGWGG
jgi:hypothetical protein